MAGRKRRAARGRKSSGKKPLVKICPKCNSMLVSPDHSNPAAVAAGLLSTYRCRRCGFTGNIGLFPEVPPEKIPEPKSLKKLAKDYPMVDTSYGRGFSGVLGYIAPIGIAASILFLLFSRPPENLLGLVYGLPISVYFTLYARKREYFSKHGKLRLLGAFLVLYLFFGPYLFAYILHNL